MLPRTVTILLLAMLAVGCSEERFEAVPVERTPYDGEWEKVRRSLLETANLRYYRPPNGATVWQLPTETEREGRGDCKALAALLYQRLLRNHIEDGRIVFGYRHGLWHAWVEWRGYVLDPAMSSTPAKEDSWTYRPYWGYDLTGKYRFVATPTRG